MKVVFGAIPCQFGFPVLLLAVLGTCGAWGETSSSLNLQSEWTDYISTRLTELEKPPLEALPGILKEAISEASKQPHDTADTSQSWVVPVYEAFGDYLYKVTQAKQPEFRNEDLTAVVWKLLQVTARHFNPVWHQSDTAFTQMERAMAQSLESMLAVDSPQVLSEALAVASIVSLYSCVPGYRPVLWSEGFWQGLFEKFPGKETQILMGTLDAIRRRMVEPPQPLEEMQTDYKAIGFIKFLLLQLESPGFLQPDTKKEVLSALEKKLAALNQSSYFFEHSAIEALFDKALNGLQQTGGMSATERERFELALQRDRAWALFHTQARRYRWGDFAVKMVAPATLATLPAILTHTMITPLQELGVVGWAAVGWATLVPVVIGGLSDTVRTLTEYTVPNALTATKASLHLACARAVAFLGRKK